MLSKNLLLAKSWLLILALGVIALALLVGRVAPASAVQEYAPDLTRGEIVQLLASIPINQHARLVGVRLPGVDLSNLYFDRSLMGRADLRESNLSGASLSAVDLSEAQLEAADLQDANLSGSLFHDADFTDANLTGADLSDADLTRATLSGADLTGAVLTGAVFADVTLDGATMPDGEIYEPGMDLRQYGISAERSEGDPNL